MQNAKEQVFQQDIIDHLVSNGWTLGESSGYDQKHALYMERRKATFVFWG